VAIDIKLWSAKFLTGGGLPTWPCPECEHGRLEVPENSIKVIQPAYSKKARSHEDWEPDWIVERFVAVMKCNSRNCGEIVVVSGDTEFVWDEDGHGMSKYLCPRSIFPGPPIIRFPEEVPREVAKDLKLSFELFWSDLGASATSLRSSVERLLDNFQVAKTRISKKSKRRVFIPLVGRIDIFKKKHAEHAESLDALRHVGNIGTHSKVERQAILAGFEVYEEALAEIYGKRSKKLEKLRKKLIEGRGKLR
jgi:hypothetical protein